jgi:hypothetical protein
MLDKDLKSADEDAQRLLALRRAHAAEKIGHQNWTYRNF